VKRISVIFFSILVSLLAFSSLKAAPNSFQLIDRAFKEGRIDYETSLVQKIYALHNPERLKPEFRSKGVPPMKSATPLYLEIKQNWDRLSERTQDLLWPYLLRPTQAGEDTLSDGYGHSYTTDDTASWVSLSGHFRIWYVRSTGDAPDMTDEDPQDGVPDWINLVGTVLDSVWAFEIDGLRYREPIRDADYSYYYEQYGMDYGGDERFDVYVEDLGSAVFGYTRPELFITPPSSQENLATCYIVIDDDYPESIFRHKPEESLKVTCAHEFFHAVQCAYRCDLNLRFFMEISSVWMEDQVYDEVNDYRNYLSLKFSGSPFRSPHFSLTAGGGYMYGNCIWGFYLSENYGIDIMRLIWEEIRQGTAATDAFDVVLGDFGSNLKDGYQDFALWNYFTDERWWPDSYYSEGSDFPEIAICDTHSQFPVIFQQGPAGSRPQYLGSNYVGFIPDGRDGGLKIDFDGQDNISWRAAIIGYGGSWSVIKQFNLDQGNSGQIQLANWEDFSQIVLISSVVSPTAVGGDYFYSVNYDSTLNNLPKFMDISIIPNPACVVQGHKKQFMVEGYDANGDTITAHPNWFNWEVIGDIGIIDSVGYLTADKDTGEGLVVASRDGMADTAQVIVTKSSLARIQVTPALTYIAKGKTQQFIATGFDISNRPIPIYPTWEVLGNVGIINQKGLFTATKRGSAEIVAKVGLISGSAKVEVTSSDPILSQSYPNPFRLTQGDKKVYFPFILPEDKGKVSITIFTISGERVKEIDLDEEMKRTGIYDYKHKDPPSWDGKNEAGRKVAEGIYLYRFQADDYTAVKKMAVLRE